MRDNSCDVCLECRKGEIITRSTLSEKQEQRPVSDTQVILKQSPAHSAHRSDSKHISLLFLTLNYKSVLKVSINNSIEAIA